MTVMIALVGVLIEYQLIWGGTGKFYLYVWIRFKADKLFFETVEN